jgi:hypothetical protein
MDPLSIREQDVPSAKAADAERRLKNLRREIESTPSGKPASKGLAGFVRLISLESLTTPQRFVYQPRNIDGHR